MALVIEERVPLSSLTTIQLGGQARFLARCRSLDDLQEAVRFAREKGLALHVLAGGSNTIFLDEGFDGLVIKVELKGIDWALRQAQGQQQLVRVAAGEDWDPFVAECVRRNLAGVECMSGIPGSVGGTPIQNVAAYGQQVSLVIREVRTLEVASLEEKVFKSVECNFGHRASRFKYEDAGKYIVTEVMFQLTPGGEPNLSYGQVQEAVEASRKVAGSDHAISLRSVREIVLGLRKKKSMVLDPTDPNTRSCGSFFENPLLEDVSKAASVVTFDENGRTRVPSAWLIEQVGYPKGFRRGGVGISANHNLALVNYGGTTHELLALADEITGAVQKKFGIILKREPVVAR